MPWSPRGRYQVSGRFFTIGRDLSAAGGAAVGGPAGAGGAVWMVLLIGGSGELHGLHELLESALLLADQLRVAEHLDDLEEGLLVLGAQVLRPHGLAGALGQDEVLMRSLGVAGAFVGLHSDLEIPMGCCIYYGGFRAEWGYTWSSMLQAQNPGDFMDVNLLLEVGVRF